MIIFMNLFTNAFMNAFVVDKEVYMIRETVVKHKKRVIMILIISVIIITIVTNLGKISLFIMSGGEIIKEKEDVSISSNAIWFDDYFTYEFIDNNTIAIGEPRYYQKNFSYLLLGDEESVLIDSGSGYRDIEPLVRYLTDLPVTLVITHYHYDHLGNVNSFDKTILTEIQIENQIVTDKSKIKPSSDSHLGAIENIPEPTIHFDEIVPDDTVIDLGNREIRLLPAPGHSRNSIVIYDQHSKQLFVGDYLIPAVLITSKYIVPDGSLIDAKDTANMLSKLIDENTILYSSHTFDSGIPILLYEDIIDLANFLNQDRIKEGVIPKYKKINEKMHIIY